MGKGPSGNWVTLREAEAETSIPVNTLRKWIRKTDLPSYLEADGDLALRMVDLDAVIARAGELGRDVVPRATDSDENAIAESPTPRTKVEHDPEPMVNQETEQDSLPPNTMIVPVDAWNKMLNQLGNLHEAGQQLAEARERAAKAETESKFLRAQLADNRSQGSEPSSQPIEIADEPGEPASVDEPPDTTTYWRYLTSGWRERKTRRG